MKQVWAGQSEVLRWWFHKDWPRCMMIMFNHDLMFKHALMFNVHFQQKPWRLFHIVLIYFLFNTNSVTHETDYSVSPRHKAQHSPKILFQKAVTFMQKCLCKCKIAESSRHGTHSQNQITVMSGNGRVLNLHAAPFTWGTAEIFLCLSPQCPSLTRVHAFLRLSLTWASPHTLQTHWCVFVCVYVCVCVSICVSVCLTC